MTDPDRRDPARWNARYRAGDLPWDTGRPDPHLAAVLSTHGVRPGPALEVGCGTGTNALWLAQQGHQVTGVDLAAAAIEQAQAKRAAAGLDVRFAVVDLLAEDVPGAPFAFAYDRGCFHVFDDKDHRAAFAARLAAHLAPGALWHSLIGSTDGSDRDHGPPRRSAREVLAAVEPHFELLELRSTHFDDDAHRHARAWVMVARRRALR